MRDVCRDLESNPALLGKIRLFLRVRYFGLGGVGDKLRFLQP